jgi:mono/diheme cytochrome c family protein
MAIWTGASAATATRSDEPQPAVVSARTTTAARGARRVRRRTVGRWREGSRGIVTGFFRMIPDRMSRLLKSITLLAAALVLTVALSACGEQKIEVARSSPDYSGAELFKQRCAGCHTFEAAGTFGSAANIRTRERTDGPNFDARPECVERVLYAIHNGGFSGAVMPANIVVGEDAQKVAEFVARYSGRGIGRPNGYGTEANGFRCTSETNAAEDELVEEESETEQESEEGVP